ncbi:MAG: class I SAM-dependent methyltransferase [Paenibacillaceae bacterium]
MIGLSKRLLQIAEHVQQGSRLADIGSDHALLPVYLAQQGIIASAIAGELNRGPYTAACKQVAEAGLKQKIEVRQGDGLEVIVPGEVDVITIAGMGGLLIVQILTQGISKLEQVQRLILQPNVGEEVVRRWLVENGWFLSAEYIVQEDGKTYEVLIADRLEQAESLSRVLYQERALTGKTISTERLLAMGPYLLTKAEPAWVLKWQDELTKLQRIVEQLSRSQQKSSLHRQKLIQEEMIDIQEVLACSQKVKPLFN